MTPEQHGAKDFETGLRDASINTQSFDPAKYAASILECESEPDEALINALGWAGVYELAGLEYDNAPVPSAEMIGWCDRYNQGYWDAAEATKGSSKA